MSPRPRQATDAEILAAAFRAIGRLGPARLTLADVAKEAGLSAAALVQRFGSKRALLLAAARDVAGGDAYIFPGLRAEHRSPLAALLGLADCMASLMGPTPDAVAHNLAFGNWEITAPDFQRAALGALKGMEAGIRALVRDAVRAGELSGCDPGRLASALNATLNGSIASWVLHRQGPLADWVRRDLSTVLRPYRARPKRGVKS